MCASGSPAISRAWLDEYSPHYSRACKPLISLVVRLWPRAPGKHSEMALYRGKTPSLLLLIVPRLSNICLILCVPITQILRTGVTHGGLHTCPQEGLEGAGCQARDQANCGVLHQVRSESLGESFGDRDCRWAARRQARFANIWLGGAKVSGRGFSQEGGARVGDSPPQCHAGTLWGCFVD